MVKAKSKLIWIIDDVELEIGDIVDIGTNYITKFKGKIISIDEKGIELDISKNFNSQIKTLTYDEIIWISHYNEETI